MDLLLAGGFAYPRVGMEEIGRSLLEARERLGLTLDEVERATRIRTSNLQALERGDFNALPSPVQARGFLNNYADFLGLDVDAILLQYAEKLQSRRTRFTPGGTSKEPATRPSVRVHSRRPRWLTSDLFIAATITLGILAILIWGGNRVIAMLRPQAVSTETASDILIPSFTPTLTETSQPSTSASTSEPEVPPVQTVIPTQPIFLGLADSVNLGIVVEARTWLRVVVDGSETFNARVMVGEVHEFQGEQVIELTTGNGAGLHVFYNGQDQGLLGEVGQVVIRLWTLEGVLTPTATLTRTPTETPPASETPTSTSTPIATPED